MADRKTRVVRTPAEKKALIKASLAIDPHVHGMGIPVFNQAKEAVVDNGLLDKDRRRKVTTLHGS
jgi:hypothetical protein